MSQITPVQWRNGRLFIIEQTQLPEQHVEIPLDTVPEVWDAIKRLAVRGAPAIGIAAAFGVVVALRQHAPKSVPDALRVVNEACAYLATSRPTAVNLFWALDRMRALAHESAESELDAFLAMLEEEAIHICEDDKERCRAIGDHGSVLIEDGMGVLTHCNAGALATGAYGTALAVMFRAHEQGKQFHAYADETRPLLQGARLTAWELHHAGIDVTLLCDNAAAWLMKEGKVNLVVVGADRIASNGDAANKIGTYGVALLAKAHGIPFYVAAPLSTFDMKIAQGDEIPIEMRASSEVTDGFGRRTAPEGVAVYNPAFDVTPAKLIAGLITERGILRPPFDQSIRTAFQEAQGQVLTRD